MTVMEISVLTGTGISAESDLPTFQDKGKGLWTKFDPMKLATPEAFKSSPKEVYEFYNFRRRMVQEAQPNAAHFALVRLASRLASTGETLNIVTQNVDNLHERAGSTEVLHIHGELMQARCLFCHHVATWTSDPGVLDACPACETIGSLRPNVVWFGETLFHMGEAGKIIAQSDLFVAIGTSGSVYPGCGSSSVGRKPWRKDM